MATPMQTKMHQIIYDTNHYAKDKYRWLLKYLVRRGEIGAVAAELELFDETYDDSDANWINDFWKIFTGEHSLVYRESQVWYEKVMIGIASE